MLHSRSIAATCVVGTLLVAGLAGCSSAPSSSAQSSGSIPKLTAEQTTYGSTPDEFRADALSFKLDGGECKFWQTLMSTVLPQLASPEQELSVYISGIDESTNVYTVLDVSPETPDEDVDAVTDADGEEESAEGKTGEDGDELSDEDLAKLEEQAANGEIDEELLEGGDMMSTTTVSDLSSVELPASSAATVELSVTDGPFLFTVMAVNETDEPKTLDQCPVIAMDVYSYDEDSSTAPKLSFDEVTFGSGSADILSSLGLPYAETYDESDVSFTYAYPGGTAQFGMDESGEKVSSISLSSNWAGEYDDETPDETFCNELRQAPKTDWKAAEMKVLGVPVRLGQTKVGELPLPESAGIDLEESVAGLTTVNLDDNGVCSLMITTLSEEPVPMRDALVAGISIDAPVEAEGEGEGDEESPSAADAISIAGLTLDSEHRTMLEKLGRPSSRTGEWYIFNDSDYDNENAPVDGEPRLGNWGLEVSFGSDGKPMHISCYTSE